MNPGDIIVMLEKDGPQLFVGRFTHFEGDKWWAEHLFCVPPTGYKYSGPWYGPDPVSWEWTVNLGPIDDPKIKEWVKG